MAEVLVNREILLVIGQIILAMLALMSAQMEVNRRSIKKTKKVATLAALRAEPTGNGYADRTESALMRIENELAGMRDDHRMVSRRLELAVTRLDLHHPENPPHHEPA